MEVVTVGRASDNDFAIQDPYVSRHHCQLIRHSNGLYEIVDISSHGTFVNGRKINGRQVLNPRDVVKVGNTCIPWLSYFTQQPHTKMPSYQPEGNYPTPAPPVPPAPASYSAPAPQVVNIPNEININKREEYSNVAKKGDDFQVSFNRNLGDRMGNTIGTTLGCIVSIIIVIVVLAIIGAIIRR